MVYSDKKNRELYAVCWCPQHYNTKIEMARSCPERMEDSMTVRKMFKGSPGAV